MDAALRGSVQEAALSIGKAVKAGDAAAVKAASVADLASNFGATEVLVQATSAKLAGDELRVSQLYSLDASARKAGDSGSADFACMLKDTGAAETDFSINGLPAGLYAFAMVEASGGAQPWLLSLLLEKQSGGWKMAGFYPHVRTAAGHDGLWYWKTAREQGGEKQALLAWLDYEEADALLQPAPFVSSTNLEKLRAEQRQAGPADLVNGVSAESPYVVKGTGGAEYRFNSLTTQPSDDNKSLHLMLHLAEDPAATPEAVRAHGDAAARALVKAHPELKAAYATVFVFADGPQGNPPVVTLATSQLQ